MTTSLADFVSLLATVVTICVFLTGFEICYRIYGRKNTGDISAVPFIVGIVNCSLWLKYGLLEDDSAITTVNSVGLALQIFYTLFYYVYCDTRKQFFRQLSMAALFLLPYLTYIKYWALDVEVAAYRVGLMACISAVAFCAAPVTSVMTVVKTKSVESLPFPLIFTTFVMALLWALYGILISDNFVTVPNVLGMLIALAQLFLFVLYPRRTLGAGISAASIL